jgi:cobalamin-dependent methionine synthase I
MSTEDKKVAREDSELEQVAETEHEYLHQRLRQELGREPTEEELDDWLRQHTEGY